MIRVSTTLLENFRKYLYEVKGYAFGSEYLMVDEDKLLSYIMKTAPTSPAMGRGSAFHDMLQFHNTKKYPKMEFNNEAVYYNEEHNIYYNALTIDTIANGIDYNFPFEVKKTKIYELKYGERIKVVSQVDQWQGNTVFEIKTNWTDCSLDAAHNFEYYSKFDYDSYAKSCQWKFYIDVFNADKVTYKVFEFGLMKDKSSDVPIFLDNHTFDCYPYVGMIDDNYYLLSEFYNFIDTRNLHDYFKDKLD